MKVLLALLILTLLIIILGEPVLIAFILGVDLVVFGGLFVAMIAFTFLSLSKGRL